MSKISFCLPLTLSFSLSLTLSLSLYLSHSHTHTHLHTHSHTHTSESIGEARGEWWGVHIQYVSSSPSSSSPLLSSPLSSTYPHRHRHPVSSPESSLIRPECFLHPKPSGLKRTNMKDGGTLICFLAPPRFPPSPSIPSNTHPNPPLHPSPLHTPQRHPQFPRQS